jgi:hypothetical protein
MCLKEFTQTKKFLKVRYKVLPLRGLTDVWADSLINPLTIVDSTLWLPQETAAVDKTMQIILPQCQ